MTTSLHSIQINRDDKGVGPGLGHHLTLALLALTGALWYVGCSDSVAPKPPSTQRANDKRATVKVVPRPDSEGVFHIHEGDSIQDVLDAAASDPVRKHVVIHGGTYRPGRTSQAMVRFHAKHDGIFLEGQGEVTLTAENWDVAVHGASGYPAVVNHVIYFGDGISNATKLKGVRITGANGFATNAETDGPIEPHSDRAGLEKKLFFYLDGGAIKVFGKSSPVIEGVEISDNQTQLCGGGISVEQRGFNDEPVRIINCRFLNNKCPATGSAIDVLEGSSAFIQNCLFVGNISNSGMAEVQSRYGLKYNEIHGCGALTVFSDSTATVSHCTFTANWNGADDRGESSYRDCIFWMNTASDGSLPGSNYELDIGESGSVKDCWFHGMIDDLRGTIDPKTNSFQASDPLFDSNFQPRNPVYREAGYRTHEASQNPAPVSSGRSEVTGE
ncbi:MAG: right-handed parallel beta-helix repeat-containing protein [Planctomycetota bacterium]|nr:right-handed parallel beta-helix repeat-containing protein [Planctomycetota bacterium]